MQPYQRDVLLECKRVDPEASEVSGFMLFWLQCSLTNRFMFSDRSVASNPDLKINLLLFCKMLQCMYEYTMG